MAIVAESRELAAQLGVLNSAVFFNDSWVDFSDRQNYLTEADAGVSTHFSHIETTFSFRTRILDYLWAELPMVVTAGDHFAELISAEHLGLVVQPENVTQLAEALELILFDDDLVAESRANIRRVRADYFWERVLQPLVSFVASPHHARDNLSIAKGDPDAKRQNRKRVRRSGLRYDLSLALMYLRTGGVRTVVGKVRRRLARR